MALNSADRKLIDDLANDLRVRFQDCATSDGVTQEKFGDGNVLNVLSDRASAPVVLSKEELRNNSGRHVARGAYLNEFAAALNQKIGITARVDLDQGLVYAQAVPDTKFVNQPMTMSQLKAEAERARKFDDDN
jgi:hypothetical protein